MGGDDAPACGYPVFTVGVARQAAMSGVDRVDMVDLVDAAPLGRDVIGRRVAMVEVADAPAVAQAREMGALGLSEARRRAIVDVMVGKAMEGDVRAAAFLFDRFYGRPAVAALPEMDSEEEVRRMDLRRLGEDDLETIEGILRRGGSPAEGERA
jgi:hypothetical protein